MEKKTLARQILINPHRLLHFRLWRWQSYSHWGIFLMEKSKLIQNNTLLRRYNIDSDGWRENSQDKSLKSIWHLKSLKLWLSFHILQLHVPWLACFQFDFWSLVNLCFFLSKNALKSYEPAWLSKFQFHLWFDTLLFPSKKSFIKGRNNDFSLIETFSLGVQAKLDFSEVFPARISILNWNGATSLGMKSCPSWKFLVRSCIKGSRHPKRHLTIMLLLHYNFSLNWSR